MGQSARFVECPQVALWKINRETHYPLLTSGFFEELRDWLLAQSKDPQLTQLDPPVQLCAGHLARRACKRATVEDGSGQAVRYCKWQPKKGRCVAM